jgi:hypothetical protein
MVMSDEDQEREDAAAQDQMRADFLRLNGHMAPMFDAADGMRAELERRGWSPTMAEATAGQWLQQMIAASFGGSP